MDPDPSIIKKIPVFRQPTISTVFCDLLTLKTDINVPTVIIKQKKLGKKLTFFVGILSHCQREQDPNPHQNVQSTGQIFDICIKQEIRVKKQAAVLKDRHDAENYTRTLLTHNLSMDRKQYQTDPL
jgi:hypothetical protein